MKYVLILVCLAFGLSAFADEEAPKKNITEDLVKGAEKVSNSMIDAYRTTSEQALESRQKHSATVLVDYSPLDLILPSKFGATFAWHADAETLYELDYAQSKIKATVASADLSEMSEARISLLKRKFGGGAFNWYWGLHYNATHARISPALMSTVSDTGISDMIDVRTLGVSFGVGHRWVFKERFSFGVDWFSWAQPVFILKKEAPFLDATLSPDDKDEIDTALKIMSYFPRWAAFKLYLGYSF